MSAAFGLAPAVVADAVRAAAVVDVEAFKPGNVSVASAGHDMRAEDFIASANAIATVIVQPGLRVGDRILRAIEATRAVVRFNTNLGIVLLCAPLVHAALQPMPKRRLRERVRGVLAELDVTDAELAYRAIRLAQPGGLGASARHDVSSTPTVTLLEAMQEARLRDRIASQYVTGFEDVFGMGASVMRAALARRRGTEWAVVSVYLAFLARFPDSHIARKFGDDVAREIVSEAQGAARVWDSADDPAEAVPMLEELDRRLKARSINPGTSADLTVATVLAMALEDLLDRVYHGRRILVGSGSSAAAGS
ncbi:MAG TPA: triphosphoribosyl-dephospho-CoA synthase [Burkholderiales bacterium]|nr:triphosphoribosyl-dephospho-CoA synthase [Burkholderiales bacterium]